MKLTWENFGGIVPKRSNRMLPPNAAVRSDKARLTSGEIRAFYGLRLVEAPYWGTATQTIYRYEEAGVGYWFNWDKVVSVVKGPVAGDQYNRVIYADGVKPRKTGNDIGIPAGGGGILPASSWYLGVKAPTAAPTLSESVAGGLEEQYRFYIFTYVTGWGEEGAPSLASAGLATNEGAEIEVTIPVADRTPDADYNITAIRIYRSITGQTGTSFVYVGEATLAALAGASWIFTDDVATEDTNEAIPSWTENLYLGGDVTWDEPPDDLHSIVAMPGGFLAGLSGNQVCFSEVYQPHAWPEAYRRTLASTAVACGVVGGSLVVGTTLNPVFISGIRPDAMTSQDIDARQSCESARSLTQSLTGVVFATPDGLYAVGQGGGDIITEPLISKKEWTVYDPTTMIAAVFDRSYFCSFYPVGGTQRSGFILSPSEATAPMGTFDLVVDAFFADQSTDGLYMLIDGQIYEWDSDADNLSAYDWKSGVVETPKVQGFAAFQVLGDFGNVATAEEISAFEALAAEVQAYNEVLYEPTTPQAPSGAAAGEFGPGDDGFIDPPLGQDLGVIFRLYIDEVLQFTKLITSNAPHRITTDVEGDRFQVEVVGKAPVKQIIIANSMSELRSS